AGRREHPRLLRRPAEGSPPDAGRRDPAPEADGVAQVSVPVAPLLRERPPGRRSSVGRIRKPVGIALVLALLVIAPGSGSARAALNVNGQAVTAVEGASFTATVATLSDASSPSASTYSATIS